MTALTWKKMTAAAWQGAQELTPGAVPDGPGVYVWWRDGEPVYVDCARRLRVRLTRSDTHLAGVAKRPSTFRSRVRLLLRERGALDADAEQARAQVDAWISGCSVSWVRSPSYGQSEEDVFELLRQRHPQLHVWRPRDGEDEWLLAYVEELGGPEAAGRVYVEVPIGGPERYGPGAKTRYIDAVRLPGVRPGGIRYHHGAQLEDDLRGEAVEVIEVKRSLNRTVIGQLVVADDLARVEWPEHESLRLLALCTVGDPALEWICEERGIDVVVVPRT